MKDTTSAPARDVTKTPAPRGRPRGARGPQRNLGEGASADAKRLAAAILEVLAGARTPTEAAQTLGLSLPRYYLLEDRAFADIDHATSSGSAEPSFRVAGRRDPRPETTRRGVGASPARIAGA